VLFSVRFAGGFENFFFRAKSFCPQGVYPYGYPANPGVLTKADCVDDPEHFDAWRSIIANEDAEHRLAHGYYVTMQSCTKPPSPWRDPEFFYNSQNWKSFAESLRLMSNGLNDRSL